MRIEYDKDSHGLFIDFVVSDGEHRYARSKEVSPGVVVDFDVDGRAIGLELEDIRGILDEKDLESIAAPKISNGAELAKFRAQLGLTQERLAEMLEVPRNTIARWERGELAIEKSRMLALALAAIAGAERKPQREKTPLLQSVVKGRLSAQAGRGGVAYRSSVSGAFVSRHNDEKHPKTVVLEKIGRGSRKSDNRAKKTKKK